MRLYRFSPATTYLSDYWNALNRKAPAGELSRLASQVEPTYLAAIREARNGYNPPLPDPEFADRLERILMSAVAHPGAEVIPVPRIPGRSSTGQRTKQRGKSWRDVLWPQAGSWIGPALRVALVLLLIAASIAGIWFATGGPGDDGSNVVVPAGTPAVEASPDISMYRGNAERTGVVFGPGPKGAPAELWSVNLPTWVQWSPAVVNGVLYVEGGDAGLYALDAFTGETLWTFDTPSPVTSGPAVVDGVVYFGSDDGTFFAVDTTSHNELWTFPGIRQQSSAAVVDGIVYVVTPEGIFYGLDAKTGAEVWQADLGGAAGGFAVADGLAYVGNANRQFQAFDAKTGEQRWSFQGDGEGGYATPTIANGVAYITASGSDTNRFYALDAATGNLLWEQSQAQDHGLISTTATIDHLYSISEDGVLHAFDATNGEPIWEYQLDGFVRAVPILSGSTLYVADNGGFIRAINAITGKEQWSYPIEGSVEFALTVAGEVVYTGTDLGNLYAITGSDSIIAPRSDAGGVASATPAPAATPSTPQAATVEPGEIIGAAVVDQVVSGGDERLTHAVAATVAPDGRIWVTDGQNHHFQIFEQDGNFVETWGEPGSGDGQFNFVRSNGDGIATVSFAPDGTFYVGDTGNFRVQHFDANRQFLGSWGVRGTENGQFISPAMVLATSTGDVWVSDDLRDDLQKFDADGNWLMTIGGTGSAPGQLKYQGCVVLGEDGSVWVGDAENHRLQQWAADGTFIKEVTWSSIPGRPVWIGSHAFDEHGNLLLADIDGSRLFVLDPKGELAGVWSLTYPDGKRIPNSGCMAALDDGRYVIPDYANGTLLFFHLDPPLVSQAAGPEPAAIVELAAPGDPALRNPSTAAQAPDGTIWVTGGRSGQFQIYGPDGSFIETWGEPGSGEGQFDFVRENGDPIGAIAFATDGSFYVADAGNYRIQHFDADRQFIGAWGTRGTENGQFISPFSIDIDSNGNIWVSDDLRNDLQKFDASGQWLLTTGGFGRGPGQLDYQGCLTVQNDDSVWVWDGSNGRLQQWASDGSFMQALTWEDIPGDVTGVNTLDIDAAGNLALTDSIGSKFVVLDPEGNLLGTWSLTDQEGNPLSEVMGCMATLDDGRYAIPVHDQGTLLLVQLDPPLEEAQAS